MKECYASDVQPADQEAYNQDVVCKALPVVESCRAEYDIKWSDGSIVITIEQLVGAVKCLEDGGSPSMNGDGYCHDDNNIEACDYDGGDCCKVDIHKSECTFCTCNDIVDNGPVKCESHDECKNGDQGFADAYCSAKNNDGMAYCAQNWENFCCLLKDGINGKCPGSCDGDGDDDDDDVVVEEPDEEPDGQNVEGSCKDITGCGEFSCAYFGKWGDANTCHHLSTKIGCDCRGCLVHGELCPDPFIECCPEGYDCSKYVVGNCQDSELCVPGPETYHSETTGKLLFSDGKKPQCASQVCNNECTQQTRNGPIQNSQAAYNGVCNDGRGDGAPLCDLGTDCNDCDQFGDTYQYIIRSGAESQLRMSWLSVGILHAVTLLMAAGLI